MHKHVLAQSSLAAALALSAMLAGAATTTDYTSSLELWSPYPGPTAKKLPKMEAVDGPADAKGIQFTAQEDGPYQGACFNPTEPIALEPGDVLKLQIRQTVESSPVNFTLNGTFGNQGAHIGTSAVRDGWTEVTVPLDPAKWNFTKEKQTEFSALKQLSVYPSNRMDKSGEAFAIASMTIVKKDGTSRSITLPDSLMPTEAEAKWMDPANWKGYIGNDLVKIPAKVEAMDTPEGKAVVARPAQEGPYQGLIFVLPEPVDLKKYKALTFEVWQTVGSSNGYMWFDYVRGSGITASYPTTNNGWRKVRIDLNYDSENGVKSQSSSADPAPGVLKQLRTTCYGNLKAPGQELALRNLHFIPKDEAELAAEAKAAAEAEDW